VTPEHASPIVPAPGAPRLAPLPAGEWGELTRIIERLPRGGDQPLNIFTTLARADGELFRRWLGFGGALLAGTLPGRLRELVILRTAFRFDGRYEWAQHIALAEAEGITRAEIVAVGTRDLDASAEGVAWAPLEHAALSAVDETADEGAVSDFTWGALASMLSESELIELLMLIAHYLMLGTVLRSLRLQLEPAAEALAQSVPGGPAS
jgi:alkylhydroperoxidase family enzyme